MPIPSTSGIPFRIFAISTPCGSAFLSPLLRSAEPLSFSFEFVLGGGKWSFADRNHAYSEREGCAVRDRSRTPAIIPHRSFPRPLVVYTIPVIKARILTLASPLRLFILGRYRQISSSNQVMRNLHNPQHRVPGVTRFLTQYQLIGDASFNGFGAAVAKLCQSIRYRVLAG